MAPMRVSTMLLSCALAALAVSSVLAQATNYTSVEATAGKPVQLTYHASAHKNCTPAPLPTVRVTQSPKAGFLIVRKAVLTHRQDCRLSSTQDPGPGRVLPGATELRWA